MEVFAPNRNRKHSSEGNANLYLSRGWRVEIRERDEGQSDELLLFYENGRISKHKVHFAASEGTTEDGLEWKKSMLKMKRFPFRTIHSINLGHQSRGQENVGSHAAFRFNARRRGKTKAFGATNFCTAVIHLDACSSWASSDGVAPSFSDIVNWCSTHISPCRWRQ